VSERRRELAKGHERASERRRKVGYLVREFLAFIFGGCGCVGYSDFRWARGGRDILRGERHMRLMHIAASGRAVLSDVGWCSLEYLSVATHGEVWKHGRDCTDRQMICIEGYSDGSWLHITVQYRLGREEHRYMYAMSCQKARLEVQESNNNVGCQNIDFFF